MRGFFAAALTMAVMGIASGSAHAQGIKSVPIDTESLVVKPVDTTTNIVGNTFKYISRITASTIDNNGYIKTINNLFATRTKAAPTTQNGLSPLPLPSQYPSTYYNSPIKPSMPQIQTYKR